MHIEKAVSKALILENCHLESRDGNFQGVQWLPSYNLMLIEA